ncbi:MAG TPA: GTPase [Candidatus Sulfotelmatobacter sp.]|nr:GTPase [Candidatus Sulfotelmatobacter sp.]
MIPRRVVILGAAGRDFHNFNVAFRDDPGVRVVAFTAAQIPSIAGRHYPPELAGAHYPSGIPIHPEADLERLIREEGVQEVVFAYSDVGHEYVMHLASRCVAAGADFTLLGGRRTMLASRRPVVAVCAVRTGCGKGAATRKVVEILRARGRRPVVVRHPMPYGDLAAQRVQRFAALADLDRAACTIEEREEYEPHLERGTVVFAGVDYAAILAAAEAEADVLVWDGGNNDLPFFAPAFLICLVDPHRPGHETTYFPGEANLLLADVVVVAKEDTARPEHIAAVKAAARRANPRAVLIEAASPIAVPDAGAIRGRRVLIVEDGPTLTHGGMPYGAGELAAERFGAAEVVDPRPYAVGSLRDTFRVYPQITRVLPAMGYGQDQVRELEATIRATPCDTVILGTPVDLRRVMTIDRPVARIRYDLMEIGHPTLEDVLPPL